VAGDEVAEYVVDDCHITHIIAISKTGTMVYNVAVRTVNNAFVASGEHLLKTTNLDTATVGANVTQVTTSFDNSYDVVTAGSWIVIKGVSLAAAVGGKILVYGTPD
jgi:hypothetical protein